EIQLYKQRTCRMGLNHLRNLATVRPVRRFFNPKNDVAFKKIFGVKQNKLFLLSFLNLILRREGDNMIEEVELLPQELSPQYEDSKKSILDVSCQDKKGRKYIVEMQNKRLSSFIQRLEYYASRIYSDQLFEGADYLELKPESNIYFLPNLSYVFVELSKFSKCSEQLKTPENYWIHLLKEASDENESPKEAPNEIQEAYGTMMAILDDEDAIRTAKNKGREEEKEVGSEETKEEITCKLLKKGYSSQDISDVTGLSASKI
ncbi:12900_t:CDS:2, partial [Funneliformis caledonium]